MIKFSLKTVGIILVSLVCIFGGYVCAETETEVRNWVSTEEFSFDENADVDSYTTTWYRPWLANYHITEPQQMYYDYKGGETGQRCWAGAVSPANPDVVLIGGDTWSIFRSEDGGVTWNPSNKGLQAIGVSAIAFYPDNGNIVFALITNGNPPAGFQSTTGIYKSTDAGLTWECVHESFNNTFGISDRMIAFSDPDENNLRKIYIASQNGGGVMMSQDMGQTWRSIGLDGTNITTLKYFEGQLIATGTDFGISVTKDNGLTWNIKNAGLESKDSIVSVRSFDINPAGEGYWYCINYGNIYESRDYGESWSMVCSYSSLFWQEYTAANLVFTLPDENGENLMLLGRYKVGGCLRLSNDLGRSFFSPDTSSNCSKKFDLSGYGIPIVFLNPFDADVIFITSGDHVCKSVDGGNSFEASSSGRSGYRVTDMWFNPEDDYDIAFSFIDHGIGRTVDVGIECEYPLVTTKNILTGDFKYNGSKTSYSIVRDPKDKNRWLATVGTWDVQIIKESTDGGLTWHTLCDTEIGKERIRFNMNNPNTIYAGSLISYDNGQTWEKSDYSVSAVWGPDNNIVYHASKLGIWKSVDEGRNWILLYDNLPGAQYVTADYSKEDRLYIGTWAYNGIFIYDNGSFSIVGESSGFKKNNYAQLGCYEIAQNPKNPLHLVTCSNDSKYNGRSSGIFESYDGGQSWKSVELPEIMADAWSVTFHPNLPRVYIGTSSGIIVYEYSKVFDISENPYLDIDESYAKKSIVSLYNYGITDKYTDGYFDPDGNLCRGEFAIMLKNWLGIHSSCTKQVFSDVDSYNRYFTAVMALYENKVVDYNDGSFGAREYLTYRKAFEWIYRCVRLFGRNETFTADSLARFSAFADGDALKGICYMYDRGIITDIPSLDSACTKQDIAHMLCQTVETAEFFGTKVLSGQSKSGDDLKINFYGEIGVNDNSSFYPTGSEGNGAVIASFPKGNNYTLDFCSTRGNGGHAYFFNNQSETELGKRYVVMFVGMNEDCTAYLLKTADKNPLGNISSLADDILISSKVNAAEGEYNVSVHFSSNGKITVYLNYNNEGYERLFEYQDLSALIGGSCGMQFQGNSGSCLKSISFNKHRGMLIHSYLTANDENAVIGADIVYNDRFSMIDPVFVFASYLDETLCEVKFLLPQKSDNNMFIRRETDIVSADTYKLFFWDGLTNIKPVCLPASFNIKGM